MESRTPPTRLSLLAPALAAVAFLLGVARPVPALDGRVDIWSNWQSGGTGATEFDTHTLEQSYRLGERYQASRALQLYANVYFRRRDLSSSSALTSSDTRIDTTVPTVGLVLRSGGLRGSLTGSGNRRDQWDTNGQTTRDEYVNLNGWLRGDVGWGALELRGQEKASWRNSTVVYRETREHIQGLRAELRPTSRDNLRYHFDRREQDNLSQAREFEQITHQVYLRSNHRFLGDRGHFGLYARGGRFEQTTRRLDGQALVIVPPLFGGVALDDTPEFQDPLEPPPVSVPALFDGDYDMPTTINIGDSAPVVRQFGGDYRNLIFDFGQVEAMSEILVYVDREVRFPELNQWLVFVSDDPEGFDWGQALTAAQVSVQYTELENQRQGWIVNFAEAISHRRVKLVNVKLGLTEPDLFINEMEVLQPAPEGSDSEINEGLWRYRVEGDLGFDLTRGFEVHYGTDLYGRYADDGDRDTRGEMHLFGASWRFGRWMLSGSHQLNLERRESGADVDSRTQHVSLVADRSLRVHGGVSYSRTDDRSYAYQYLSQYVSGDLGWRIAPRLDFVQRLTYGLRDTRDEQPDSESWTSITELRGAPRPSLEVTLNRRDRWVSRDAGPGFTTFNETTLSVNWAILPLVSLISQALYQVREDDSLQLRNTLSWTPLPGGSMSLRLYALDYQDTRTDYFQRGGGFSAIWRPRPRLRFEGGYEITLLKQDDLRNTPEIWNLRGTWTF